MKTQTLRVYYAAVLKGTEPAAVDKVYRFLLSTQRTRWLKETTFPFGVRVKLTSKVAKKHDIIEVNLRSCDKMGATVWVWMYNNVPDFLT